jgi:hypothetical protein
MAASKCRLRMEIWLFDTTMLFPQLFIIFTIQTVKLLKSALDLVSFHCIQQVEQSFGILMFMVELELMRDLWTTVKYLLNQEIQQVLLELLDMSKNVSLTQQHHQLRPPLQQLFDPFTSGHAMEVIYYRVNAFNQGAPNALRTAALSL